MLFEIRPLLLTKELSSDLTVFTAKHWKPDIDSHRGGQMIDRCRGGNDCEYQTKKISGISRHVE